MGATKMGYRVREEYTRQNIGQGMILLCH